MMTAASHLRELLNEPGMRLMPCCYDALSARLIERAGFRVSFMSGFAVAATRLAMPDTGLISYDEILDQGRNLCAAVDIPIIGDGDTGHGNAVNVLRTVKGFARAGFAGIMIEDQVSPKRCGHTPGKQVVDRAEAVARVRAACDARDRVRQDGGDILIMGRTDANATDGFDEALTRVQAYAEAGADMVFLEAPKSEDEMSKFCAGVPVPTLANMLDQGETPVLPPARLAQLGFKMAAYPLSLLLAGIGEMERALDEIKAGRPPEDTSAFAHLRDIVGFDNYDALSKRYEVKHIKIES